MRIDGDKVKAAEGIEPSQVAKTSNAIFSKDESSVDTLNSLTNHTSVFILQ